MVLETVKVRGAGDRLGGDTKIHASPPRKTASSRPWSSVETSVSEVALMWILHQHALLAGKLSMPLHQQISDFSTTAFKAILSDTPSITQEHLWMIYFKGLIVSNTHPREIMVQAIHLVQAQNVATWKASVAGDRAAVVAAPIEVVKPSGHADTDVLQHITTALGKSGSQTSDT